ncbi:methylated-DNA-protein-cysteine methyltransferase-like protein [Cytobacillus oceanisediminis]|uniref:Methylated-DNA-protein-cysteine methyltransferase-like protein n=1 Tax=Cytobacillus oceanisediminis TaxID=665099 RepID=A0A2V2ZNG4_9BACI|nr:MGMT family protein [Cytobacillus oceanisediminis]PWW25871.1 methylated-DNA-protein-cysteine methyltransferase-like protein [Cytobacillus oceanisediminis]
MQPFTVKAIKIIQNIPSGKVMTYGQIAKLAGSPRGARQVVRILHSLSEKHLLPWHRVVNGKGEIGFKDDLSFNLQRELLEKEEIYVSPKGILDLQEYLYDPLYPH